jgi:malate synthase
VFDEVLGDRPNQLDRQRDDVTVTADDLLNVAATPGQATRAGLHNNVEVSLLYLAAWLRGSGAVGIHNLMEDAATAEVSRSQIWQWVHNGTTLEDGTTVTAELVREVLDEEVQRITAQLGDQADAQQALKQARDLFEEVALAREFVDFLTLPAYDILVAA